MKKNHKSGKFPVAELQGGTFCTRKDWKKRIACLMASFFCLSLVSCGNDDSNNTATNSGTKIEHIVLFHFSDDASQNDIADVIGMFLDLRHSLKDGQPYINTIEYGFQNSQQGQSRGYEIAFRVSFNSEEDRDYYVGRPFLTEPGTYDEQHDAFKAFVGPLLEEENGVLVFDYETNRAINLDIDRLDHLLLFNYREDVTEAQKQEVTSRFLAMGSVKKNGVPLIRAMDYGYQNSQEGVDRGYDIAFRIAYFTGQGRDYHVGISPVAGQYDTEYESFMQFVWPLLEEENGDGLLVFDYYLYE